MRIQGFHDIATVLQLTLPPELALPALEKLSLHRLRDSMGHTLEPLTALMLYVFSRHYYVVALIVATVSYSACYDLRIRPMPHY